MQYIKKTYPLFLSILCYRSGPFFECIILYKYKNHLCDLVDDLEDFVINGSRAISSFVSSVNMLSINEFNIHSGICKIDNHIKYYLAKSADIDGFYGYHPHYGWNKLSHDILTLFSKTKVKEASLHKNKEILLNVAGYRMKSNDNEIVEGQKKLFPLRHQQNAHVMTLYMFS